MAKNKNKYRDQQQEASVLTEQEVIENEQEETPTEPDRKVKTIDPSQLVEKHNITEPTHQTSHPERIEKILNKRKRNKISSSAECLMKERVNRILENLDRQQK